MKKTMAVLTLALATAAFAPRAAAAEGGECAYGYTECLNDTWMLTGWSQKMADVECFAEYLGCLRNTLTA